MNERIKELRKFLGLNQTEFGKKIGLTQRPISEIEQGGNVTERNFNAICQIFNVNPKWLRDGVGEMFIETREAMIQDVAKEFELTDDETALIRTFLKLTPEQRAGVMAFIKNFAETHIQSPTPARKPDSELTREEKLSMIGEEIDAEESSRKKGATTSSASTGTSGTSKKFGKNP